MEYTRTEFWNKTFTPHHFHPGIKASGRTSSEGASLDVFEFINTLRLKWWGVLTVLAKFYSLNSSKI